MSQIQQLGVALEITLAAFVLIIAALFVALIWFLVWLHWQACLGLRPPQVERDGQGRRIKERV